MGRATARGDGGRCAGGEEPTFHNIASLHWQASVWRYFVLDGPLPRLVTDVIRARRVIAYADVLMVKEAGAATRTPWHHDPPYWPFRAGRAGLVWTALDDVTQDNGALEYVAGSHRFGRGSGRRVRRRSQSRAARRRTCRTTTPGVTATVCRAGKCPRATY